MLRNSRLEAISLVHPNLESELVWELPQAYYSQSYARCSQLPAGATDATTGEYRWYEDSPTVKLARFANSASGVSQSHILLDPL